MAAHGSQETTTAEPGLPREVPTAHAAHPGLDRCGCAGDLSQWTAATASEKRATPREPAREGNASLPPAGPRRRAGETRAHTHVRLSAQDFQDEAILMSRPDHLSSADRLPIEWAVLARPAGAPLGRAKSAETRAAPATEDGPWRQGTHRNTGGRPPRQQRPRRGARRGLRAREHERKVGHAGKDLTGRAAPL